MWNIQLSKKFWHWLYYRNHWFHFQTLLERVSIEKKKIHFGLLAYLGIGSAEQIKSKQNKHPDSWFFLSLNAVFVRQWFSNYSTIIRNFSIIWNLLKCKLWGTPQIYWIRNSRSGAQKYIFLKVFHVILMHTPDWKHYCNNVLKFWFSNMCWKAYWKRCTKGIKCHKTRFVSSFITENIPSPPL